MVRRSLPALALLLPLMAGLAAAAQPPMSGWLDPLHPACFSRTYDAAHMKAHPKQKVVSLSVRYLPMDGAGGEAPSQQWEMYEDRAVIHVTVAATLRDQSVPLMASAQCGGAPGATLDCTFDADGGTVQLEQHDTGARLKNPAGFAVSPATGNMEADFARRIMIDPRDDHDVFLLPAATGGLCDVKWPEMR